jgi:hypothetical protein
VAETEEMTSSFRLAALRAAVIALAGVAADDVRSQTANNQVAKSPARLAKDIAFTISVSAPKRRPGAPVVFESATSHDNFVEVRYIVKDPAMFSRLKNENTFDQIRLTKISYYCNESRITHLNQGVVIHDVTATSDDSDRVDLTIDKSSCEGLPKPQFADAKTLAALAQTVAKAENEDLGKEPPNALFRLDGATAHDDVVDVRFIVRDAAIREAVLADRANFAGFQKVYFCSKHRGDISRGLTFHPVFVLPDGSPVLDFAIDKSSC